MGRMKRGMAARSVDVVSEVLRPCRHSQIDLERERFSFSSAPGILMSVKSSEPTLQPTPQSALRPALSRQLTSEDALPSFFDFCYEPCHFRTRHASFAAPCSDRLPQVASC